MTRGLHFFRSLFSLELSTRERKSSRTGFSLWLSVAKRKPSLNSEIASGLFSKRNRRVGTRPYRLIPVSGTDRLKACPAFRRCSARLQYFVWDLCAAERIRTSTVLLPPAPQAGASASSATAARGHSLMFERRLPIRRWSSSDSSATGNAVAASIAQV